MSTPPIDPDYIRPATPPRPSTPQRRGTGSRRSSILLQASIAHPVTSTSHAEPVSSANFPSQDTNPTTDDTEMSSPAGSPPIPRERKDSEASHHKRDSIIEVIEQHWPFNKRRSTSGLGVAGGPATPGDLSDSGSALQGVLQKDEAARKHHHNKLHRHKHQNSEGSLGAGSESDSDAGASSNSKPKRFNTLTRVLSSYRKRKPSDVGETGSVNSSTHTSPQKERSGSGATGGDGDVVMSPVAEDHKEKEDGALDLGSPPSSPTVERSQPSIVMTIPAIVPGIEESGILVHHPSEGDLSAGTKMTPVSSAAANSTTFAGATGATEGDWENVQGESQPLKGKGSLIATDDGTLADESDMSFMNQPGTVRSVIPKGYDGSSMDVHPGDSDPSQAVPATPAIKSDFTPPITPISTKAKLLAPIDEKSDEDQGPLKSTKMQNVETAAQYAIAPGSSTGYYRGFDLPSPEPSTANFAPTSRSSVIDLSHHEPENEDAYSHPTFPRLRSRLTSTDSNRDPTLIPLQPLINSSASHSRQRSWDTGRRPNANGADGRPKGSWFGWLFWWPLRVAFKVTVFGLVMGLMGLRAVRDAVRGRQTVGGR